jgi:copper chaperone
MNSVTYTVPNINCGHCVHTIKNELSTLAGVDRVDAMADTKQVTVHYNPPADEAKIKTLLAEINYPVA